MGKRCYKTQIYYNDKYEKKTITIPSPLYLMQVWRNLTEIWNIHQDVRSKLWSLTYKHVIVISNER
jgi:hypothetical protein